MAMWIYWSYKRTHQLNAIVNGGPHQWYLISSISSINHRPLTVLELCVSVAIVSARGPFHGLNDSTILMRQRLVGGWPTPLKNMSSSVGIIMDYYSQYMEKCSKPPTRWPFQQWVVATKTGLNKKCFKKNMEKHPKKLDLCWSLLSVHFCTPKSVSSKVRLKPPFSIWFCTWHSWRGTWWSWHKLQSMGDLQDPFYGAT